jgi:outer membrane lipoprotein-sorting protein
MSTHIRYLPTTLARAGLLLLLIIVSLNQFSSAADTVTTTAQQIIDEMENLYRGNSSEASITMLIKTPNYQRKLTMQSLTLGEERAFFRILAPKKDRGVATLKRDQEMWNYFPKINKVMKVPPSMMMGSWMGSDFTNDDLVKETSLVDSYAMSLAENETEYIITLTPMESTVTVWGKIDYIVSKSPLLPKAQIFYDDDHVKMREMKFLEPKEYDGKLMPSILEMRPLNKDGHTTRVIYESMTFDAETITEDTFSLRNLKSRF